MNDGGTARGMSCTHPGCSWTLWSDISHSVAVLVLQITSNVELMRRDQVSTQRSRPRSESAELSLENGGVDGMETYVRTDRRHAARSRIYTTGCSELLIQAPHHHMSRGQTL